MITLHVISLNGAPAPGGPSASFDEMGGTIGRADTNQLVLSDPERTISRVHAHVVYRRTGFAIVDRGSNPILVNEQPVGNGREAVIADGDRVQIGGFLLAVKRSTAAHRQADETFAGLLGPAVHARAAGPLPDPLAGLHSPPPPAAPPAASGIPDDWNPFAPDPAPATQDLARSLGRQAGAGSFGLETGAAAPSALVPDLPAGVGHGESLDALFGLAPGGGGDPLADSLLGAPATLPNTAGGADPLRSLTGATHRAEATAPLRDDICDLQLPFTAPPGVVLSWDNPASEVRTVIRPSARAPEPPVAPAAARTPVFSRGEAANDDLLAAFREGLASPGVAPDALTPELMRLLGELLHESARGLVDLLMARAALKREVRAQATMIVAHENNPLKFAPNAEAALAHLLSPAARGFMPAAPALRDAFDDLRAHQFGFVAGMRAALDSVLARFAPDALEERLTQRSLLQSLLPGRRKARLWEVFSQHYAQISREAEDDFHSLFGKAFLRAYEEHIAQLHEDRA